MPAPKRVIVSVINDLVTDQRVNRSCMALVEMGYEVLLVGRKLPRSLPLPQRPYRMHRMRLLFTRGALFYAEYNFRLFLFLLFRRAAVLHSNDLDTLLANHTVARLRGLPLVYDSHEYFTEVPELEHNAFAKKTWKRIEQRIVPKLRYCITVNASIARLFHEAYGKEFRVMRNVPLPLRNDMPRASRKELGMPEDKIILVLQGSGINMHRGAEELVEAMALLDERFHLYIIGGGDVMDILKQLCTQLQLEQKITFLGKQPYEKLFQYTCQADAGLTLDKDTNINYRYSLPNKIFDYIQAGIPVIASDLVELRRIIEQYRAGVVLHEVTPDCIAQTVQQLFSTPGLTPAIRSGLPAAAATLNWDHEKKVLQDIYAEIEIKKA